MNKLLFILLGVGLGWFILALILFSSNSTLNIHTPKPDPPTTNLKTIKVIDANKQVSYLSWECITNE
jgi:hypothetical protein